VVLAIGGVDVIRGRIDLGTLVAFFTYVGALFWPMFAMGWVVSLYQRGTASLDRINKILGTEPVVKNADGSLHSATMKGDIEISSLTFAYEKRPVLKDIRMSVNAGETIGLVGLTGSGKSTIVSLLTRLYPVADGCISIDGVDINKWDLESLRSQIGFATQEAFLFSDSVAGNIRFGKADADQPEMERAAATAALAKDVADFPKGYDTIVGERGITLSGGQKQRTAIARAVVSDPTILILDDVTSAVDTETEDEIFSQLAADNGKRTRIIISHRVSSVKGADRIYYLHDGEIVEQGRHDELMELDGHYAALYRSQLLAEEIDRL
jgi:ATP-binding cassette subfamily B protein